MSMYTSGYVIIWKETCWIQHQFALSVEKAYSFQSPLGSTARSPGFTPSFDVDYAGRLVLRGRASFAVRGKV